MDTLNLKNAALLYAAKGFTIFPLKVYGKEPATPHGFYDATTDINQIDEWWNKNPNYNIGIVTGNGFAVIDLDVNHGGSDRNGVLELEKYQAEHGTFPETAICITPRGGKHLYYAVTQEKKTQTNLLPGIDICGTKHYVVAPPSVTENGKYRWEGRSIIDGMAPADETVEKLINLSANRQSSEKQEITGISSLSESTSSVICEGGRHSFLLSKLGKMQHQGLTDDEIREVIGNLNRHYCAPPMTEEELEKEIFEALTRYEKGVQVFDATYDFSQKSLMPPLEILQKIRALKPYRNDEFQRTDDITLAKLFANLFHQIVRFNTTANTWYVYDGVRWITDEGNMVVDSLMKDYSQALCKYCSDLDIERDRHYIAAISTLGDRRRRVRILEDACSYLHVHQEDFDRQDYLFNCKNCVIDLRDNSVLEHSPDLLLSKVANVYYNPDAKQNDFVDFMDQIMMGDREKVRYLQNLFGYAMSGSNEREEAYILYGRSTRNGK